MPSDYKHIDDLFRKKEAEYNTAAGSADVHWQQMQQLLIPGKVKSLRNIKKTGVLKYAAVTGGLILFSVLNNPNNNALVKNELPVKKIIEKKLIPKDVMTAGREVRSKRKSAIEPLSHSVSLLPVISAIDISKPQLVTAEKTTEDKKLFINFYQQLEKPAQVFVINNKQDTLIHCKEGSSLFIPAGSFQTLTGAAISGVVRIYVKEFYNIADIIANKLTTTSNGQPLISGGMLHISGESNNEEVQIRAGSSLQLSMPANDFDPMMELFVQQKDTTNTSINWVSEGQQQFFLKDSYKTITVTNLMDNPYDVVFHNGKTIGKFFIPYDCKYTVSEMKEILLKKYARRYDIVKVQREWKPLWKKNRIPTVHNWYETNMVGDEIEIPLKFAAKYHMITTADSLKYEEHFSKVAEQMKLQIQIDRQNLLINNKYSFSIKGFGWINCDRFSPKTQTTEFFVSASEKFDNMNFQATVVLKKQKSIMSGYMNNGKIYFSKLPVGQPIDVICVGTKNGKVYTAIQSFAAPEISLTKIDFEETSPEQFREKLTRLSKRVNFN